MRSLVESAERLLNELTDEALVAQLEAIHLEEHRLLARLLLHLIEVEERRLHLRVACSSLFDFCLRRLGMSGGAAFRRIAAARLVRRFPRLLGPIERGEIHLSTLVLLRDHLTEANFEELIAAVSGKTTREVEELMARRAPRPDVPATIRKLPTARGSRAATGGTPAPAAVASARRQGRIEPLSDGRYKMELTSGVELRDKVDRARDLLRHRNPSGNLEVLVHRAFDALLENLENERLAAAARPRPLRKASSARSVSTARPRSVTRAARREVFERDGEQCTFRDDQNRRCPARGFLEIDHVESKALGGSNEPRNLRVFCRSHNRLHAEQVFGRQHVARHIDFRRRKSSSGAAAPERPP